MIIDRGITAVKMCNGDCYILQQLFLCKIWRIEVNERVQQLWFLAALFLFLSFYHYFLCCIFHWGKPERLLQDNTESFRSMAFDRTLAWGKLEFYFMGI